METNPGTVRRVLLRALFAIYRECHDYPTDRSMAIFAIVGDAIHELGVTEADWHEALNER